MALGVRGPARLCASRIAHRLVRSVPGGGAQAHGSRSIAHSDRIDLFCVAQVAHDAIILFVGSHSRSNARFVSNDVATHAAPRRLEVKATPLRSLQIPRQ